LNWRYLIKKDAAFQPGSVWEFRSPTLGKVKVPSTVLAPVTNLVDDILGTDCDVFYSGALPHPN